MSPNRTRLAADVDLFDDAALDDPYPYYRQLRDLGPAAYLTRHDMWFLSRYDRVREALLDWQSFSSAAGVGLNAIINAAWADTVVGADPPVHTERRRVYTDQLSPRHIKPVTDTIQARAAAVAERLTEQAEFDAVTELAHDLPVHVVMDLIGWPLQGRDQLLSWASGSFNVAGPANERMLASLPRLEGLVRYLTEVATKDQLAPGSFGAAVYEAVERGTMTTEESIGLMIGYATPALDTTINAIGSGMWLFATNPEQWAAVRADPSLIPSAFNEIVRMESPVQFFTRTTTREIDLGQGAVLPAGSRVLHSYGAANRDERHFPDPERFDVARNPSDHLGFGYGVHACPGQALARLEAHALFAALARRVSRIEVAAEPERELNNITRGFAHVRIRVG
jgi:cytochrome P450